MELRLTIVDPGDGALHDVMVRATPNQSVADLRAALARRLGMPIARLSIGAAALPDDLPVGMPPLLDGAHVVLGDPVSLSAASALRLDVVGGPDCGGGRRLTPGRVVVGRDSACDLVVTDPHLSRRHAVLDIGVDGVRMVDLGSTNGTPDDVAVEPGAEFALGTSRFAVRRTGSLPAVTTSLGDGTVAVHRRPHLASAPFAAAYARPRPPVAAAPPRFPWLPLLLPLPICGALAFFLGPQLLALALLGPIVSGATAWSERRSYRRTRAADEATYAAQCAIVDQEIARAQAAEKARLLRACPDPALVRTIAVDRSDRLWERPADAPVIVRLGTGAVPSQILVTEPVGHRSEPGPPLLDAPVTVDLSAVSVLGICAPASIGRRLAEGLVGQIAALHSPAYVSIALQDRSVDRSTSWASFLPHGKRRSAHVVVDLTGTTREVGISGREPGELVVAVGSRLADLPSTCGAILTIDATGWGTLRKAEEETDVRFVVDQVHEGWLDDMARALAPCRDADGESDGLPDVVELAGLHGLPVGSRSARHVVRSRWAEADDGLAAVLGATASGPMVLDLGRDGPHALIGGTTGSGKSELLQALVAGLAVAYPPSAVTFLLIDYKGGSAFGECARLPHTTGVVTDLSGDLANRALVSLRAEIRRREQLFADAGASDLAGYRRLTAHDRARDPVPRLVVVVDEFRMLVEEQPAFVEGIVRLATLGRSLGLHLVLATQRPAGCVTADIQANVNVRIALRVRDKADSEHVIEIPDAAALPDDAPGRAIISLGDGRHTTFQTAFGGMPCTPPESELTVVDGHGPYAPSRRAVGPTVTELESVVDAVASAHEGPAPRPVWHEPLPESVSVDVLQGSGLGGYPVGLLDRPDVGTQEMFTWDPLRPANLAFIGGSGSGRSTALRTLAVATAAHLDGVTTHVHVVDTDGALGTLAALPHVGTVVDPTDRHRFARFVARLREEVRERRRLLADRGLTDLGEWLTRDLATAPPRILVLVDGWETLAGIGSVSVDVETLAIVEDLQALLETSRALGIHAAVAGGRTLLHGRGARLADTRITFVGLEADSPFGGLAGARGNAAAAARPGHGSLAGDGGALLMAHVGANPRGGSQVEAIARLAANSAPLAAGLRPWVIAPLPDLVPLCDAPNAAHPLVGPDEDGRWIGFDPARDGKLLLISGPRRSGRTSTLLALAAQAAARGVEVAAVSASAAGSELWPDGVAVFGPDDASGLRAWLAAHRDGTLLVDDAERLVGSPADQAATEATAPGRFEGWLIAAVETSAYGQLFRGLAVEVGRRRTGILLSPRGLLDGEAFGVRVARADSLVPGRGYVISAGEATAVQVAYAAARPSALVA